jgi:hypothetical protein
MIRHLPASRIRSQTVGSKEPEASVLVPVMSRTPGGALRGAEMTGLSEDASSPQLKICSSRHNLSVVEKGRWPTISFSHNFRNGRTQLDRRTIWSLESHCNTVVICQVTMARVCAVARFLIQQKIGRPTNLTDRKRPRQRILNQRARKASGESRSCDQ